jgi:autophagy-related protein 27
MLHSLSLSFLPLLPSLASAAFDCSFDVSSHHFNLTPLKGLHTTSKTADTPPTTENTTVFLDLCQDLHWDSDIYDPKDRCEEGTQGTTNPLFYGFDVSLCDKV